MIIMKARLYATTSTIHAVEVVHETLPQESDTDSETTAYTSARYHVPPQNIPQKNRGEPYVDVDNGYSRTI